MFVKVIYPDMKCLYSKKQELRNFKKIPTDIYKVILIFMQLLCYVVTAQFEGNTFLQFA